MQRGPFGDHACHTQAEWPEQVQRRCFDPGKARSRRRPRRAGALGDLIAGSANSFIATLVERHTRFVMLAKVSNKDSHIVIQALINQARKLHKELYKSLTWDRGTEIAGHKAFTLATVLSKRNGFFDK